MTTGSISQKRHGGANHPGKRSIKGIKLGGKRCNEKTCIWREKTEMGGVFREWGCWRRGGINRNGSTCARARPRYWKGSSPGRSFVGGDPPGLAFGGGRRGHHRRPVNCEGGGADVEERTECCEGGHNRPKVHLDGVHKKGARKNNEKRSNRRKKLSWKTD